MIPPRPVPTDATGSLPRLIRAFRRDLLSGLPQRLYRGWMAEYRNPLIHSFFCNDPALIRRILRDAPEDFPKSSRLAEGLRPLLGHGVFLTNGAEWARQRRIIDPAFEGGRLRQTYPAIWDAAGAMIDRLQPGETDIEPPCSHAAADVIFRSLFSLPIDDRIAAEVFAAFRIHQASQPLVNLAALLPLPDWLPRLRSRRTRRSAARIRALIRDLVETRLAAIAAGTAPDDLATKIMTTADPQTGDRFDPAEMIDQVAVFFLAGHETSAAALAWSLWLLAACPDWQDQVAAEGRALSPEFSASGCLPVTRAVFREALRLYPPLPMMVREATRPQIFRGRLVPRGAQLVVSPWHLHRHERLWQRADEFDPARWQSEPGKASARDAFLPFSAGPRACPGAGLAMLEGPVMLARVVAAFRLSRGGNDPVPIARLTLRSRDGILIRLQRREDP